MKKILIVIISMLGLSLVFLMLKNRKEPAPSMTPLQETTTPTNASPGSTADIAALDTYMMQAPNDSAAPLIRRLTAAFKARPELQNTVLAEAAVQSVQD